MGDSQNNEQIEILDEDERSSDECNPISEEDTLPPRELSDEDRATQCADQCPGRNASIEQSLGNILVQRCEEDCEEHVDLDCAEVLECIAKIERREGYGQHQQTDSEH